MKLILAIVQDYDCDRLLSAVTNAGLRATRIASTGGFLRTGNTTVLMGVDDSEVSRCLQAIADSCKARVERRAEELLGELGEWTSPGIVEVTIGGAVVFVLTVSRFLRIPMSRETT